MGIQPANPVVAPVPSAGTVQTAAVPQPENQALPDKVGSHCETGECVPRDYALGAFRQELRSSLKADFRAMPANPYDAGSQSKPTDEIADETLLTARQAVAENPVDATRIIVSIRSRVHEVAQYVQRQVAPTGHDDDVDTVVAKVDSGLDEMESAASLNREASTTALDIDLRSKQKSTVRIRTQEGDVVRFDLRQFSHTSVSHEAATSDSGSYSVTEVEASAKTRMLLRVKGDLNEAELSAIQGVFEQAGAIAAEFFEGDMAAALSLVSGMEFDTEQLARVRLGFRSQQVSQVAYSNTVTPEDVAKVDAAPAKAATVQDATPTPVEQESVPEVETVPVVEAEAAAVPDEPVAQSAIADFFAAVSAFLRSTSEGFADEGSGSKFRLHFSESFKLDLLKAVIHTTAPEKSEEAADGAIALIDSVADGGETD